MRTDQLPANELRGILNYMEKFLHAMIDIWEMRYRFFYFVINNRREKEYQSHLGVIIDYLNDVVKEIKCPLRHKQLCGIICKCTLRALFGLQVQLSEQLLLLT